MAASLFSRRFLDRLRSAKRLAVLTGAGISAESGIATFRDAGGLWSRFRPEELANVDAFLANPDLVQRWYAERRRIAMGAQPNAGHRALAELEALVDDVTVITQNVDDLHRRAGSTRVVELHGTIMRDYCIDCKAPGDPDVLDALPEGTLRTCGACGGYIRPDVVWFGEMLPSRAIEAAFAAARRADVCLSVGTSGMVFPAADVPLKAREHGAYVVEINVEPSAIAGYLHETVLGEAGTVLPRLIDALRTEKAGTTMGSEPAGEPGGE